MALNEARAIRELAVVTEELNQLKKRFLIAEEA